MNRPQKRITVYAVAGIVLLFLLVFVTRYLLRETPSSAQQEPPTIEPSKPPPRQAMLPDFPSSDGPQASPANEPENSTLTNAAAIYRQAFALYGALSKDEKGILVDWRTNVDASVEAELCEKMRPICELMHQATAVTNCDWGIEQPLTYDSKLPHLSPARAVSRAAIWNAAHCRQDDAPGASEDVLSTLRLGKSVSSSALIGSLVDVAIQGIAESYLAANIGLFRGADGQRLSVALSNPAYEGEPPLAMEQEASIHERLMAKLASLPADEFDKTMSEVLSDTGKEALPMDRAMVLASLQQIVDSQRALAKALASGSVDEYKAWQQNSAELQNSDPLAKESLAGYDKYVDRMDRGAVNRALLVAGLAVAQEGPSALPSHLDPSTDQPFVYTETSDGFQLQSGYKTNGVPLRMQFK
jgi:hypothetical protein